MTSRYRILTGNIEGPCVQITPNFSPFNSIDKSLIVGPRRSGKTMRLVNEITNELKEQSNTQIVFMGSNAAQIDLVSRGLKTLSGGRILFCTERSLINRIRGFNVHSIYVDDLGSINLPFFSSIQNLLSALEPCTFLKKMVCTCPQEFLHPELRSSDKGTLTIFGLKWNVLFCESCSWV